MLMTLIDAFAQRTPVIATKIGAMLSMIKVRYKGIHFATGSAMDLA
jgi:hypothetical protein